MDDGSSEIQIEALRLEVAFLRERVAELEQRRNFWKFLSLAFLVMLIIMVILFYLWLAWSILSVPTGPGEDGTVHV